MKKKFKLGVIGAGFMSTAIVKGVIKANVLTPEQIIVSDPFTVALEKMSQNGVVVTTDNKTVAEQSEFVLFAVKPQSLDAVLESIKGCTCAKFISIMAGVKKDKIKKVFPQAFVARCMPNTPCAIGNGAIGLDASDFNDEKDVEFIKSLLELMAEVVLVDEQKLNAVTGVSGSSPAYFYLFLKGIIDAGIKHGLTDEQATLLAASTMIGAGKMVLQNRDKTLDELVNAVCSKGGTTIEAVKIFQEEKLENMIEKAVDACVARAFELENL